MASLRTTTASCFGCITSRPLLAAKGARPAAVANSAFIAIQNQTRGKKTVNRDQGVVVRLLKDITQFGRQDTILRVDRGRMRNFWYPLGMAEYMTAARMAELGPAAADAISQRDTSFVAQPDGVEGEDKLDDAQPVVRRAITLKNVSATDAALHIETIVPSSIVFYRKPISIETSAIFGSVSADDVANTLREILLSSQDEEAMLVRVEPRDVRFVVPVVAKAKDGQQGEDEIVSTVDRIKALGRWEVDIVVRGTHGSNEPARRTHAAQEAAVAASSSVTVRKIVEVIAAQD